MLTPRCYTLLSFISCVMFFSFSFLGKQGRMCHLTSLCGSSSALFPSKLVSCAKFFVKVQMLLFNQMGMWPTVGRTRSGHKGSKTVKVLDEKSVKHIIYVNAITQMPFWWMRDWDAATLITFLCLFKTYFVLKSVMCKGGMLENLPDVLTLGSCHWQVDAAPGPEQCSWL